MEYIGAAELTRMVVSAAAAIDNNKQILNEMNVFPVPDGDTGIPVILDDALVTFDDKRMSYALEYLSDMAKERQILLYTCHKREYEYLGDRANVIRL